MPGPLSALLTSCTCAHDSRSERQKSATRGPDQAEKQSELTLPASPAWFSLMCAKILSSSRLTSSVWPLQQSTRQSRQVVTTGGSEGLSCAQVQGSGPEGLGRADITILKCPTVPARLMSAT